MKTVAVLTPTYNRAKLLGRLFESLCNQTLKDFSWYVVDDGSTDNTEGEINKFNTEFFEIKYIRKENGGKHTALNVGLQHIVEPLVLVVDSDDWLDEIAIETISSDWKRYDTRRDIAGLSYYKMYIDRTIVSDPYPSNYVEDTFINMRVNKRIKGDCAEVFRRDVLLQYPFPVIPSEKFLSEAVVWNAISEKYGMVFISKGIYFCEYQSDGLSSAAKANQLRNPLGTMLHAKAHMSPDVKLAIRLKYGCLYMAAARFAGISFIDAVRKSQHGCISALGYIPGSILYKLWKRSVFKKG